MDFLLLLSFVVAVTCPAHARQLSKTLKSIANHVFAYKDKFTTGISELLCISS